MRDIKFRAWDTVENKMIENLQDRCGLSADLKCCNHIVMQYTDLKDKGGKEIYGGDIVQSESYDGNGYDRWLIRWNNLTYECIELPWDKENEPPNTYDLSEFAGRLEIIGNIHQNPELMR